MDEERRILERSVRTVQRRLAVNNFLHSLAISLTAGLAVGLAWFLIQPWVITDPPVNLRWLVLGSLLVTAFLAACIHTVRIAPSRTAAALELDGRFATGERVTTALWLPVELRESVAGKALLNDASAIIKPVRLADRFPVRPRRSSLLVPCLAGALALTAVFYKPDTASLLSADEGTAGAKAGKPAGRVNPATPPKPVVPFTQQRPPEFAKRADKSAELQELEKQLDKLMDKWAKEPPETPERAREKVSELTSMEEKLRKFEEEKAQRLAQLEDRFRQMDKLNHDREFLDGPLDKLNDAMSKGDLKEAKDQIDELKKKSKDKSLSPDDLKKLERQMEQMKEQAERLARDGERRDKLKEKLEKAKKEGRDNDAEALQRELKQLEKDGEKVREQMEKLAEQMSRCQHCAESGDMEQLAEALESLSSQLKDIEGELSDMEDANEYLQRLRAELKKACSECEGMCQSEGENDWAKGAGVGAGRRDENPNAASTSVDERQRGLFDPKGKKSFGGSVRGNAFTKKSTAELGPEIERAAQEASRGLDAQNVPRDAQPAVREYMEAISGKK